MQVQPMICYMSWAEHQVSCDNIYRDIISVLTSHLPGEESCTLIYHWQ